VLLADAEFGTVIRVEGGFMAYPVRFPDIGETVPVMWPSGYSGRWLGSEVEVSTKEGDVVATTGGSVSLGAPGPVNPGDALAYPTDHGAFPTCGGHRDH
jgi:hypothetical protein